LVAFELARKMSATGRGPMSLFVSGCKPPRPLTGAAPAATDEQALTILRASEQVPDELLDSDEFLTMFLPVFKADLDIVHQWSYRPGHPLACPITTLAGAMDSVPVATMLEWQVETTGPFSLQVFDGGHFFVETDMPAVVSAVLAELVKHRSAPV
jgi:surfactin synthase thioesterase subunit